MAEKAAIVTGASSGIGLAIARMLGGRGYALTIGGRRPDKLEAAANELREAGLTVEAVAGSTADEAVVDEIVAKHQEAHGRLDVLVNNAGIGIGAAVADIETKKLDIQVDVNLRATILFYRKTVDQLRASAKETGASHVINTASIAGKGGEAWLSVYSAAKAGVIAFTRAMNKELADDHVKSTALCPAFVDTPMTDFVKGQVPAEEMITPDDIATAVAMLLDVSPACVIPEIVFERPDDA